jgi:hypothetical protein
MNETKLGRVFRASLSPPVLGLALALAHMRFVSMESLFAQTVSYSIMPIRIEF